MFYFAIPLISRQACLDWRRIEALLSGTLGSILHSTAEDYLALIACHEVPATGFEGHGKIEFLRAEFPPLMGQNRPMLDKICKLRLVAQRVRSAGGGYLMLMDADDLVSNRLVEYVLTDRNKYGYYINKGYELDYRRERIRPCPRFHRVCGSSIIMRVSVQDLPQSAEDETDCYFNTMIWKGHYYCERVSKEFGRPLKKVPFAAGVYVLNSGESHSQRTGNVGLRRRLFRAMVPSKRIDDRFRREFSLASRDRRLHD